MISAGQIKPAGSSAAPAGSSAPIPAPTGSGSATPANPPAPTATSSALNQEIKSVQDLICAYPGTKNSDQACRDEVKASIDAVSSPAFTEDQAKIFALWIARARTWMGPTCEDDLSAHRSSIDALVRGNKNAIGLQYNCTRSFINRKIGNGPQLPDFNNEDRVFEVNSPDSKTNAAARKFTFDNRLIVNTTTNRAYTWRNWLVMAAKMARAGMGGVTSENIQIPKELQDLINQIRNPNGPYPNLTPDQRKSMAGEGDQEGDLQRLFRQSLALLPRDQWQNAINPLGQRVVDKAKPMLDNEGSRAKAPNDLNYLVPGAVANDPTNGYVVTWRSAPQLTPNASPTLAAEERRLFGQALDKYATKGGDEKADVPPSLLTALRAAVNEIPQANRADALANSEVKDVVVEGGKATKVILGPSDKAPDALISANSGSHERSRIRAINGIWKMAITKLNLPEGKLPSAAVRQNMVTSLARFIAGKNTIDIRMSEVTGVTPDGTVTARRLPRELLNSMYDVEKITLTPGDGQVGDDGVTRKLVVVYQQARALRDKDSRPAIKNMTDAQLARKVNEWAGRILYKEGENSTRDTAIFCLDGTKINGFKDNGDIDGVAADPTKAGGAGDPGHIAEGWRAPGTMGLDGIGLWPSNQSVTGIVSPYVKLSVVHSGGKDGPNFGGTVEGFGYVRGKMWSESAEGGSQSLTTGEGTYKASLIRMGSLYGFGEFMFGAHKVRVPVGFMSAKPVDASSAGIDSSMNFLIGYQPLYAPASSGMWGVMPGATLNFIEGKGAFDPESKAYGVSVQPRLGAGLNGALLSYSENSGKVETWMTGSRLSADLTVHANPLVGRSQILDIAVAAGIQRSSGERNGNDLGGSAFLTSAALMYQPTEWMILGTGLRFGKMNRDASPNAERLTSFGADARFPFAAGGIKHMPRLYFGYQHLNTDSSLGQPGTTDGPYEVSNGPVVDRNLGSNPLRGYEVPYGFVIGGNLMTFGASWGFQLNKHIGLTAHGLYGTYNDSQNTSQDSHGSVFGLGGSIGSSW